GPSDASSATPATLTPPASTGGSNTPGIETRGGSTSGPTIGGTPGAVTTTGPLRTTAPGTAPDTVADTPSTWNGFASSCTTLRRYGPPSGVRVVSAFATLCAIVSIRCRCADRPLAEIASPRN